MEKESVNQLSTLGHPQRLAIFRLLMRRYPDRVAAGELASTLGIKASTLSTYLSALTRDGLIEQQRAGTSLLYSIHMPSVQGLFGYLFGDCCRGRPDICMPAPASRGAQAERRYNVLFICTGNSARSIFAEALLRGSADDRFAAYSAGTQPGSDLNPFAVQILKDKGHDTSALRAKHVSEFSRPEAPEFDFVFTVCDQAANEDCVTWNGRPVTGHWGIADPVRATGNDVRKTLAFESAYTALKTRIDLFTALDLTTLSPVALQQAVDDIGRTNPESPL